MTNVPFIIKNKVMQTMVPTDSELYDENQESRIQVVQAINGYLTVSILLFRSICSMSLSSLCGPIGIFSRNVLISPICRLGLQYWTFCGEPYPGMGLPA